MVGALNLAHLPTSSRARSCWLFHSSLLKSDASNARRVAPAVLMLASPLWGHRAHTMPLPAAVPLAEIDSMQPGQSDSGIVLVICDAAVVRNLPPSSRNALRLSKALQT